MTSRVIYSRPGMKKEGQLVVVGKTLATSKIPQGVSIRKHSEKKCIVAHFKEAVVANPLSVRLEYWEERPCDWPDRYVRDDDPTVVVFGVEGTPFVVVREVLAVNGVGALICDFLGVSATLVLDEESKVFAVAGEGLVILLRRPARRKLCCSAA